MTNDDEEWPGRLAKDNEGTKRRPSVHKQGLSRELKRLKRETGLLKSELGFFRISEDTFPKILFGYFIEPYAELTAYQPNPADLAKAKPPTLE